MLNDYQKLAIQKVRERAKEKMNTYRNELERMIQPFHIDVETLVNRMLESPITINFHPDRWANHHKTVIENLLEEGQYYGQFQTGTTNGGKTAFVGGDRFLWEQRLFYNAYPEHAVDRPKYGALNVLKYWDGASVRFGSCYFVLKKSIIDRCTFAYGDSSANPAQVCTWDTFVCVLIDLFKDVRSNGKLLNQVVSSEQEALAILFHPVFRHKILGRNLDHYIETHIHGDVRLREDVESFYMDESYKDTPFAKKAYEMCQRYEIHLEWIPARKVFVNEIGPLFRGPMIPKLAQKIDRLFGHQQGVIHAALLGEASRDSERHPEKWKDIGSPSEVFQYMKQLWHTIGYFG